MDSTDISPIEIEVTVSLGDHRLAARDAQRHLCALHGYPDGVPLDQKAPEALQDAAHRLMIGRRVRLHVHVATDGSLRIESAGTRAEEREACAEDVTEAANEMGIDPLRVRMLGAVIRKRARQ